MKAIVVFYDKIDVLSRKKASEVSRLSKAPFDHMFNSLYTICTCKVKQAILAHTSIKFWSVITFAYNIHIMHSFVYWNSISKHMYILIGLIIDIILFISYWWIILVAYLLLHITWKICEIVDIDKKNVDSINGIVLRVAWAAIHVTIDLLPLLLLFFLCIYSFFT